MDVERNDVTVTLSTISNLAKCLRTGYVGLLHISEISVKITECQKQMSHKRYNFSQLLSLILRRASNQCSVGLRWVLLMLQH